MDFTVDRVKQMTFLLKDNIYSQRLPVKGWRYCECGYKKDNVIPDKNGADFRDFGEEERWGKKPDSHAWFCNHIVVPEQWRGKDVRFSLITGKEGEWDARNPQFIAYIDGVLTQGMDVNHTELYLQGLEEFDLDLYAYAGLEGTYSEFIAELRLVNPDCEKLYYDLRVPYEVLLFSDPISKSYADILRILNRTVDRMDCRVPGSEAFNASLREADAYLQAELYQKYAGSGQDISVICIGHTHIDVAWLWTLAQTREKTQRSFATVLSLMKRYPEYKFMSSQAQLYDYLKQESPETYEEVKKMIAAGRWEVEGAMWVEADCNLTSGESLVRQVLFGKRFFKKEFGVESKVLWLPDVFGYSAALPQILKKAGVDYFVTSKISWNETNTMPYDMFRWRGLDGTEIFSYFLTAQKKKLGQKPVNFTTYVSNNDPDMIAGTWDRFQQKEFSDQVINTFGFGDGGGGPTAEMLELRRRMENGFGEVPNARIGTATEFLEHIAAAEHDPKLPVWSGELYLELHRGTYTSIGKNKRNNRYSEQAYQFAEMMASLGNLLVGIPYPQKELNEGWEKILLFQFHDIIPGSSIKEVYDECDVVYPKLLQIAQDAIDASAKAIAANVNTQGGVLVFNPQSFVNSGTVVVDGETRFVENIPAKGYAVVTPKAVANSVVLGDHVMENEFLKVTFDENYNMVSIFDKQAHREVIDSAKGPGNQLEVYEDFPRDWDAWEISNYYRDKRYTIDDVVSAEPVRDGARAGFVVRRRFLDSTVEQHIWMYEDVKKIDFETVIDWKQEHLLAKVAFPVNINSNRATFEVQFGTLERPTHTNTSWDAARFEVVAHKYCDFAEYGYGVAMLNDCKYGHDVHDGVMRLTLLKSATYPNVDADRCTHYITYSIVPHQGDYREAGVVQLAYDLNKPMTAIPVAAQAGSLPDHFSLVSVSAPNVVLETVKKAEDSDDLVLRMYEAYNQKTDATVTLGFTPKRVTLCGLMEDEISQVEVNGNAFTLPVKPFEIITVKVER